MFLQILDQPQGAGNNKLDQAWPKFMPGTKMVFTGPVDSLRHSRRIGVRREPGFWGNAEQALAMLLGL